MLGITPGSDTCRYRAAADVELERSYRPRTAGIGTPASGASDGGPRERRHTCEVPEPQSVWIFDSRTHVEYWVPAEDLADHLLVELTEVGRLDIEARHKARHIADHLAAAE